MRAAVNEPFHHPVTGALVPRATVLSDDEIAPLFDHPDLMHKLSFSDRTPVAAPVPVAAAPAYQPPASFASKE